MSPSTKENLLIAFFLIVGFLLAATIILFGTGCASAPRHASASDGYIEHAAAISGRIQDKAVIVQQWIQKNQ